MDQTNPLPNPTIQPQIPINPPANPPIQPSSPKKSSLIFLLAFLFIVLVSLGAYGIFKFQVKPQIPVSPPAPSVQTSPTPSAVDETAGWKTYSANKYTAKYGSAYNFIIKYPSDWTPEEHDSGTALDVRFISPDYKVDQNNRMVETTVEGKVLGFSVYPNKKTASLENWYSLMFKNIENCKTSTNTETGLKYLNCSRPDIKNQYAYEKIFAVNNTIYVFGVSSIKNSKDLISLLDSVVSTFKFLDQAVDETTNWKTYTNNQYGYSFKYPSEWINQGITETDIVSEIRIANSKNMTAFIAVSIPKNTNDELTLFQKTTEANSGEKIKISYGNRVKIENTTILGFPSIIYSIQYSQEGENPEMIFQTPKVVEIKRNDNIYRLSVAVRNKNDSVSKTIFDQILSTFKFN